MAVKFVYTAREHHGVQDVDAYLEKQRRFIEAKQRSGMRFAVHESAEPLEARIDANSWIVDCSCGAGNATDPAWGIALCLGCGAIHTNITFPAEHADIEAVLVERRRLMDRAWKPGETLQDLVDENELVNAPIPDRPNVPKKSRKRAAREAAVAEALAEAIALDDAGDGERAE